MTINEVLKDYVIENGGVTQGKSTSELLKEAIGEVIPAPEDDVDPDNGGDNADPSNGGDNGTT